jgi:predicted lipoprotein with Yx(FWY)xxD motif
VLLAAARYYGSSHQVPASDAKSSIPLATPPGITLQLHASTERKRVATAAQLIYADARGMSLYTYEKDTPPGSVGPRGTALPHATSACTAECAAAWQPAIALPTAAADGDWSFLERAGGKKQWMYAGAPLYTFEGDKEIGETTGDGAEGGAWHVAVFRPGAGMALPDGIAVREIADAGGVGLVDSLGMTLYAFEGDATQDERSCSGADCTRLWIPLEAPEIAGAMGEFSVRARRDGITQWAYRGKPLYKFERDQEPGEVNGNGLDDRFRVALLARFFTPANVTIRRTLELGTILATRSGATLYQRDRVTTAEELHPFRADHGSPALGRALGTSTCDENCAKFWPPLTAPADATPTGYWDVVTRPDGTRQWAFKGFALYTYVADKPGDINGNATYTLESIDDNKALANSAKGSEDVVPRLPADEAAGAGLGAMFWHAVVP